MPVYQFTATDQNGAPQQGTFEAANEEQAYSQLAQYGLTVSQLIPNEAPAPAPAPAPANEPEKAQKKKKSAKSEKAAKPVKPKKKRKRVVFLPSSWVVDLTLRIFQFLPVKCLPLFMPVYPY